MDILFNMIPMALMFATPIIIAGLGGLFSERSGIVNIALEGLMLVGAFAGATTLYFLQQSNPTMALAPWIAIGVAALAGLLFSVLHAVASINFKADQVISGTAINLLATGVTIYLCQIIFHQQRTTAFASGFKSINVPVLSELPGIGKMFTNVYPTIIVAVLLVVLTWFVVYKTRFGLRLRACGEFPQAADSMGVSVTKMRYSGVLISGLLAGLAGGIMVATQDTQFTAMTIHGTGFIALAALIFGKWSPWGVLGAGIFFGFSQVLAVYANDINFLANFPIEFFKILPYLLTILALLVFSGKSVGPKAAGEIYDKGKR